MCSRLRSPTPGSATARSSAFRPDQHDARWRLITRFLPNPLTRPARAAPWIASGRHGDHLPNHRVCHAGGRRRGRGQGTALLVRPPRPRPGPPAPGPAVPGTGNDDWYSPSCPTLHDIAPGCSCVPTPYGRPPAGKTGERCAPGSASPGRGPSARHVPRSPRLNTLPRWGAAKLADLLAEVARALEGFHEGEPYEPIMRQAGQLCRDAGPAWRRSGMGGGKRRRRGEGEADAVLRRPAVARRGGAPRRLSNDIITIR